MDHNYGVNVQNKFSLFIDEETDPFEALNNLEEESKSKKKDGDKKASKKNKKAAPAPEVKKTPEPGFKKDDKPAPRSDRGRGGFRNRENRDFQEGDRRPQGFRQGPRENRGFDENTPPEFRERREGGFGRRDGEGGFGERGRGGRGRGGRGRGEGRGGFGSRGGFRGGFGGDKRREFDRRSGDDRTSGVKAFDKREGGGAHNWGTFKDDVESQEQDHQNDSADWSGQPDTPEKAVENGDAHQEEGEEGPKAEPEPVELTLDEWKAMNAGKASAKTEFKVRQISKWTGTKGFEYKKKNEEEEEEEESEEEEDEEDPRQKKIYSDIRITFNENPSRGGRGRGGRGRGEGRGGRGRGEERGERGGFDGGRGRGGFGGRGGRGGGSKPREAAPRFDDEADFPSLVKLAA